MSTEPNVSPIVAVKVWKRVLASILDFCSVFFVGGSIIAWLTGSLTADGFELNGTPAVILLVLLVAYFYIGRRHVGGTLWDRVFRIGRPQPN